MRKSLLVLLVILNGCSSPNAESCVKMEAIGRNTEKVAYLKTWIQERMLQEEFLERFGSHGRISAIDDKANFLALGLDLDLLGIHPNYGFVELHRKMEQGVIYKDSKVVAVSIGEGRNAIVLDLRQRAGSVQEPMLDSHGGLRFIGDGVFLSCR